MKRYTEMNQAERAEYNRAQNEAKTRYDRARKDVRKLIKALQHTVDENWKAVRDACDARYYVDSMERTRKALLDAIVEATPDYTPDAETIADEFLG